jgi:mono/diheme cytochrome c family protein
MKRLALIVGMVASISTLVGCQQEIPDAFETNLVQSHKYAMTKGLPMDQVAADTDWALRRLFGTPNDPKVPEGLEGELASLISMERLKRAAGPIQPEGSDGAGGLYRRHCATCHGENGSGRGPTGAILNPYPRDYRMGVFKFKSTARAAKPTRDDMAKLIRNGIKGTAMVPIPALTDEDVQSLVDYVIYLSWRGELERVLIDTAVMDLDLEASPPERLIDTEYASATEGDNAEKFKEQWDYVLEPMEEIGLAWQEASDEITEVELPTDVPMPKDRAEFVAMMAGDQSAPLQASIDRGRELFGSELVGCAKCHGKEGKGDGQTADFDDWTKDWTAKVGLDPKDAAALTPLLARGALPPLNIQPRNFAEGVFRGGSAPEDLYRRVINGIAGTPMPAATFVEGKFEQADVWHLINFIRSLDKSELPSEVVAEQPVAL